MDIRELKQKHIKEQIQTSRTSLSSSKLYPVRTSTVDGYDESSAP